MHQALENLRVVDLSRVIAGPFMAQHLADLGADVIKIERPNEGDELRDFEPRITDQSGGTAESAYFSAVNRGKRSITVDFQKPQGQALIKRLIANADILVENYKAGTMARYGLDYENMRVLNPRLIYISITGFGQTGPYRDRPGYDYVFQAMSGLLSLTGGPDHLPGGGPAKVGAALFDVITSLYSAFAVTAALRHRDKTGEGQYIDMSLLDAAIASICHINLGYLVGGIMPGRLGSAHPNIVPYQAFDAQDGQLVVAIGNDRLFVRLCKILGRPELAADERFKSNALRVEHRDVLVPEIARLFATQTVAFWTEKLSEGGIPASGINNLAQVFADPHVQSRGMKLEMSRADGVKVPILANPIRFSKTPVQYNRAPPKLGEHTRQILSEELGLTPQDMDDLASDGII